MNAIKKEIKEMEKESKIVEKRIEEISIIKKQRRELKKFRKQ